METLTEYRIQSPVISLSGLIRDKDENISYRRREKSCQFH